MLQRLPRPGECRPVSVLWSLAAPALLALAVLVAEAPPATAQWGDSYDARTENPYASPPPRRRAYRDDGYGYGYGRPAPRRYAPPPPPQEAPRQFYWPWEDRPQQAQPQPQPQPQPPTAPPGYGRPARPRAPAVADETRRKRQPRTPPAVAAPKAAEPKAAPSTQVVVFGDSLASYLGKGLDEAFEDNADVAVIDRSKGDSGLVRRDVVDWAKSAEDYLKANPKTAYALIMLGVNDRQPIREGDQSYDPLSDKWREIYLGRVDALLKVFADQKVPLIWVGLPPVRSEGLSTDFAAINDLVRERVQKAGQSYVDVWPGFVDERNRFAANGPDVDGQEAKLRTSDGVHFTNAGSRKVAHFADVELKRLMGAAGGTAPTEPPAVATAPGATSPGGGASLDDTSAIDRKIAAMLPSLPEPPGIPSLPVKPAAGPVVPLGRAESSPGGQLVSGRPREGDAMGTVERALQRGAAPLPQPGRADDFRWPPG